MKGVWERERRIVWSLLICDREMGDGETGEIVREEMCRAPPRHEVCSIGGAGAVVRKHHRSSLAFLHPVSVNLWGKGHNQLMLRM